MGRLSELLQTIDETLLPAFFSLLIGVAAITFVWGVIQFMANAANEKLRDEGKKRVLWSLIGLSVVVGMWGLVSLLLGTVCSDPECSSDLSSYGSGGASGGSGAKPACGDGIDNDGDGKIDTADSDCQNYFDPSEN